MNTRILNKIFIKGFPLEWANLDYLPDSDGRKVEIYLSQRERLLENLVLMFHILFQNMENEVKVYSSSWWDFCLDTWDYNDDNYNYELDEKSNESRAYLIMLKESGVENGYSGTCVCADWDKFLSIILACILTHQAPYSPIFYDDKSNFFFYFHHTGSIGFYYKSENEAVLNILNIAKERYGLS